MNYSEEELEVFSHITEVMEGLYSVGLAKEAGGCHEVPYDFIEGFLSGRGWQRDAIATYLDWYFIDKDGEEGKPDDDDLDTTELREGGSYRIHFRYRKDVD